MATTTTPTDVVQSIEALGLTPSTSLVLLADRYEVVRALRPSGMYSAFGGVKGQVYGDFLEAFDEMAPADIPEAMRDAALQAVVQENLGEIFRSASYRLAKDAAREIRATANDLVQQAQPVFAEAAAKLAEVVDTLGPDPDPQAILDTKDADEATKLRDAWDARYPALQAVKAAAEIRALLATYHYGDSRQPQLEWYLDPDQGKKKQWTPQRMGEAQEIFREHRPDPFSFLLEAGFRLRLCTVAESGEIAQKLADGEAKRLQEQNRTVGTLHPLDRSAK